MSGSCAKGCELVGLDIFEVGYPPGTDVSETGQEDSVSMDLKEQKIK